MDFKAIADGKTLAGQLGSTVGYRPPRAAGNGGIYRDCCRYAQQSAAKKTARVSVSMTRDDVASISATTRYRPIEEARASPAEPICSWSPYSARVTEILIWRSSTHATRCRSAGRCRSRHNDRIIATVLRSSLSMQQFTRYAWQASAHYLGLLARIRQRRPR